MLVTVYTRFGYATIDCNKFDLTALPAAQASETAANPETEKNEVQDTKEAMQKIVTVQFLWSPNAIGHI